MARERSSQERQQELDAASRRLNPVFFRLQQLIEGERLIVGGDMPPLDDEGGLAELHRPLYPPDVGRVALERVAEYAEAA